MGKQWNLFRMHSILVVSPSKYPEFGFDKSPSVPSVYRGCLGRGRWSSLPVFPWWAWGSARMRTHFPLTSVHFRRQVCLHRTLGFWSCVREQLNLKNGRPETRQCGEVGGRAVGPSCLECIVASLSFNPQVSDLVLRYIWLIALRRI